jgi:RimJ/RimL family protein N-acetyltransferase
VLDGVVLRGLTTDDLTAIAGWFEDPHTRRFLGGPEWPTRMLTHAERAVGTVFRGARRIGAHHYLAIAESKPAGYVDCGTFDRCSVYGAEGADGPIMLETIDAVTGSIAFVVAPVLRGRGLGRAMIAAMLARLELRDVELFEAGVEPQNIASRRCLEAAGFELRSPEPDFEGMLYYCCWRRDLVERRTGSA